MSCPTSPRALRPSTSRTDPEPRQCPPSRWTLTAGRLTRRPPTTASWASPSPRCPTSVTRWPRSASSG
eukprot:4375110-Alexandrium_andersonii.AAC.1